MINKIKFYEVYDCFTCDGRGPATVIATFSSRSVAETYAVKKGNYGNNANVREGEMIICDNISDLIKHNKEKMLADALLKLSEEEMKVVKEHFQSFPPET